MKPGSTVVPVRYVRQDGPQGSLGWGTYVFPTEEMSGYLMSERSLVDLSHYEAAYNYFQLQFRPDTDPVEQLFAFRPRTGELYPSPAQDRVHRARAAKTIHILGLNSAARCQARMKLLRDLRNAHLSNDKERLRELARAGPYRFVAAYFLSSLTSP